METPKRLLMLALCTGMLSMAPAPVHAQCSMCTASARNGVESTENPKAKGLNDGILMLLAMPYLAVAVVGVLWYRNSKYTRARRLRVDD